MKEKNKEKRNHIINAHINQHKSSIACYPLFDCIVLVQRFIKISLALVRSKFYLPRFTYTLKIEQHLCILVCICEYWRCTVHERIFVFKCCAPKTVLWYCRQQFLYSIFIYFLASPNSWPMLNCIQWHHLLLSAFAWAFIFLQAGSVLTTIHFFRLNGLKSFLWNLKNPFFSFFSEKFNEKPKHSIIHFLKKSIFSVKISK